MTTPPLAFARLLVPFRPERVLALDDDLLVLDKPHGLSTHATPAPGEPAPDDALTRARDLLAARGALGPDGYVGSLYTVDRDASGVVLFTRRRAANAPLARQFETGSARFTLVAAVSPWPARAADAGTLRARVRAERGGVRAVGRHDKSGRDAELRYRVLARSGPRALLSLTVERGPLGQVPAQLAALGCAVAGEGERGGAQAPRRMLHVESLGVKHPAGYEATFRAPAPRALRDWVEGVRRDALADEGALDEALAAAAERRYAVARGGETTAFRLANDAGDDLPGVTVDAYGAHALVQFYSPEAEAARERVLDAVARAGAAGVYAKFRPRQANTLVDTRREDLAPAHALRGADAPEEFTVRELGVSYRVRLGDGLSTGIFLDQRENRRRVRELCAGGKSLLNLFAYTCPFTVAAAAGGAGRTVSVDASAGALAWAARNLEANGLAGPEHLLVTADVFGWLEGARARGDRYDVVALDPPSYSTTRDGSRFSAESDYRALAAAVLPLVARGGKLLACSNHRGIPLARFHRHLSEAVRAAGVAAQLRDLPPPADFPPPPGRESHLKSVLITVA